MIIEISVDHVLPSRRITTESGLLHLLEAPQILLHITLNVYYWGIIELLRWLLVSHWDLLWIRGKMGSLKTGSVKSWLWYALGLLLVDVVAWGLCDGSLLAHYLGLRYVLLRLIDGLVDVHLLALVLRSGGGNRPTEYGLRLGAHPVLTLGLVAVVGLAHLLLGPLFLASHVLEILQFLLVVLNELHAARVSLSDLLDRQRIRLHMIQNDGLNACIILLHQVLVFQFLLDVLQTLNIAVDDLAHLVRVAERHDVGPPYAVKFQVEVQNEERIHEVYEGEADAALRFQVDREIEVVVPTLVISVQKRQHIRELDFCGNVLDHEGRQAENLRVPSYMGMDYPAKINLIIFGSDEHFLLLLLKLFGVLLRTALAAFPLREILLHKHGLLGLTVVGLHLRGEVVVALLEAISVKLLVLLLLVQKQLLVSHGVILIGVVLLDQWVVRSEVVAGGLVCMSASIHVLSIEHLHLQVHLVD